MVRLSAILGAALLVTATAAPVFSVIRDANPAVNPFPTKVGEWRHYGHYTPTPTPTPGYYRHRHPKITKSGGIFHLPTNILPRWLASREKASDAPESNGHRGQKEPEFPPHLGQHTPKFTPTPTPTPVLHHPHHSKENKNPVLTGGPGPEKTNFHAVPLGGGMLG